MNNKKWLIAALVFPILVLLGITIKNQTGLSKGKEFTLPVEGFDPRDLISGHYLMYRVVYGSDIKCPNEKIKSYVCMDPKTYFSFSKPSFGNCSLFIKGDCDHGNFKAGIERFYIPEQFSRELTEKIVKHKGKILISVSRRGDAQVKDLLIENCPWKNYISGSCPK